MTGGFMLPPRQPATSSSKSSSSGGSCDDSDEYQPRIVLCEDKKIDRQTFDNTIIHELIHAYDVCRAKIDWKKCEHHACTEIRASALSGECAMSRELLRGQYNIRGGHRECVKRRASKSLAANVYCKDSCSEAIEAAFEQCYADVKPFSGPRG
jgi:inner membrane protease ATP23